MSIDNMRHFLTEYLLEEGKYNPDNYSQNIEIISSIPDSLALEIANPRIVLISEKVDREDLYRYKYKVHALAGRLDEDGDFQLHKNYNGLQEEILNRRSIVRNFLKNYPFLNQDASVIGYYDWSIEGLKQIVTLLKNETQDYFIEFGYDTDDELANLKKKVVDFVIKEMEESSNDRYKGIHDTYRGKELYLLKKNQKVKTLVKTLYR